MIKVLNANCLDLDKTPSKLGASSRSKLFDAQSTFLPILSHIEALWKLKQTRNLADDNLIGGLRVKACVAAVKSRPVVQLSMPSGLSGS